MRVYLKGLAHEIFWPVFWPVWIHLGLNMNCLWFLHFNGASLILDNYFKFWRVSGQTFSEILRISEKVWQETHLNLKCLSQIKGASLKLKNQMWFIFRPRSIHTGQKTGPKISCDSPFKNIKRKQTYTATQRSVYIIMVSELKYIS
jgi:hypothetical protein